MSKNGVGRLKGWKVGMVEWLGRLEGWKVERLEG